MNTPMTNSRLTRTKTAAETSRGFTLVEVVITIVVLAIIGTVTATIILTAMNVYNNWSTRADLQSQLSGAMDRIVAELRTITVKPSTSPVQPDITTFTASSIVLALATWGPYRPSICARRRSTRDRFLSR